MIAYQFPGLFHRRAPVNIVKNDNALIVYPGQGRFEISQRGFAAMIPVNVKKIHPPPLDDNCVEVSIRADMC